MQRIVMHRSAIVHGLLRFTTHVRDFRETVQTSTSKLRTKQPIVRPTRVASRSRRRRIDFAARASVARTRVDNAAALHRRHPAPRVESTIASLHGLRDHSRPAPAAADEDISATCGNTALVLCRYNSQYTYTQLLGHRAQTRQCDCSIDWSNIWRAIVNALCCNDFLRVVNIVDCELIPEFL